MEAFTLSELVFGIIAGMLALMAGAHFLQNGLPGGQKVLAYLKQDWLTGVLLTCLVGFLIWSFSHTQAELGYYSPITIVVLVTTVCLEAFLASIPQVQGRYSLPWYGELLFGFVKIAAFIVMAVAQMNQNYLTRFGVPLDSFSTAWRLDWIPFLSWFFVSLLFSAGVMAIALALEYDLKNKLPKWLRKQTQATGTSGTSAGSSGGVGFQGKPAGVNPATGLTARRAKMQGLMNYARELDQAGRTQRQIADAVGRHPDTIGKWKRQGWQVDSTATGTADNTVSNTAQDVEAERLESLQNYIDQSDDWTVSSAGAHLGGLPRETVRKYLNKIGVNPERR